jgi:hypothetical protein
MLARCQQVRTLFLSLALALFASGCTVEEEACPTGFDFAPEVGESGSTAVAMDDNRIVGWASAVESVAFGEAVDEDWMVLGRALGPAEGTPGDVVALGRGGYIVLRFDPAIADDDGPDLAVFENSLNNNFLELAFVEVSSNGEDFARFPNSYQGTEPVATYAGHEASWISGLAGKYRIGHGTPFDLTNLVCDPGVMDGTVDISSITHVRVVDIVGDGESVDSSGRPIYDPYPTVGSAGFDLDAVATLHIAE